jgi:hypothetical protein
MELIVEQNKNWINKLFNYFFELINNLYFGYMDMNEYFLENHLIY